MTKEIGKCIQQVRKQNKNSPHGLYNKETDERNVKKMIDLMDTAHTFEFQFYKHENQVHAALHIIDNNFQTIKFGNIDVNKENQKQFEVITGYGWVTTDHFEKGVKLTLDSLKYRFECTSNRLMVSEESEVTKRIEDGRGNGCIRKVPGHRITTYTEDTCETVWE